MSESNNPAEISPSFEAITKMMPPERRPYILGNMALADGDREEIREAIVELYDAHMQGILRPPIPSVLASRTKEAIKNFPDDEDKSFDKMTRLLMATIIDFGYTRFDTDLSFKQRRAQELQNVKVGNRTVSVRPNPTVIPKPARNVSMRTGKRRRG